MENRTISGAVLCRLVLAFVPYSEIVTAQGHSPSGPATIGTTVISEVQCGERASLLEPYDLAVTVKEAVRGKQAWLRIKAANNDSKPPEKGFEYILTRLGFELKARGAPADKIFELGTPLQILAISAEGKEYATPPATVPGPGLQGILRSGDAKEGWIVFSVPKEDLRPLMIFDPSSGGGMHRGKILFFKLY